MKINSKNFKVLVFSIGISIMGTACSNESEENYKQALEYSENNDYEKAVEYFEKAIEEDSQKADYYIDYGYTLTKMGNYTEAVAQFNKAILSSEDNIVEPDNQITRKNNKNSYTTRLSYLNSSERSE